METDVVVSRDDRFKEILKQQFGSNGIALLANQSFVFVLALIALITICVGLAFNQKSSDVKVVDKKIPARHPVALIV